MTGPIIFKTGQQVRVNHTAVSIINGEVVGRVPQPEFIGTVIKYWRNGAYIVREPQFGTNMAYDVSELSELPEWRKQ